MFILRMDDPSVCRGFRIPAREDPSKNSVSQLFLRSKDTHFSHNDAKPSLPAWMKVLQSGTVPMRANKPCGTPLFHSDGFCLLFRVCVIFAKGAHVRKACASRFRIPHCNRAKLHADD
mmetsp:Transcript_6347/g.23913  ORF Transcript_6347/g.23913 Transcript_6347/m.23913 type:complete len:118 (-) Transcript_6347:3087-3440(-)